MKTKTQQAAQEAYFAHHYAAGRCIKEIAEELSNMPAPSDMTHWGHVGDMYEINRQLRDVLARIRGEER